MTFLGALCLTSVPIQAAKRQRATEAQQRSDVKRGVIPSLVGWDLNDVGDGTGVLYDIQEIVGLQKSVYRASSDVPDGVIISQIPKATTGLSVVKRTGWQLVISDGGPVTTAQSLSKADRSVALSLGIDPLEPLRVFETKKGRAYKNDKWLFGHSCAAVEAAYRISADARYDNYCVA